MAAYFEKRDIDFYFRDDRGGKTRLRCSPHLHPHIEFVYMIEGCAEGYADSGVCTIRPGDFFIAFPNQIHRFESNGPEKYLLFIVDPDLIPEFCGRLLDTLPSTNLLPADQQPPELALTMHALAQAAESSGEHRELILRGYLLALFGIIFRHLPAAPYRSADNQLLRAVMDYCTKNYTRPLSLSSLADELHLSKYYVSHLFSDKLKVGFNDYVNSLRVSAACRLLIQTEFSITDICAQVGFSTLRTFNRAFLRHAGVTPSAYRKNSSTPTSASMPTG